MATIRQDYSPIDSLQKMVDNIPNCGGDRKKHKKHKKDKKEQVPQQPLQPQQTTSDFAPDELLKEMGFDISPSTSSTGSSVSPTSITMMDEKKYDLNICLFHNCNLELFQAVSNMEWYVKCPFTRECGLFTHRNEQNSYMGYSTGKFAMSTGNSKD